MRHGHEATGMRQKWMGRVVILVALLVTSAVPGQAWRGGHRFGGHHFRHHGGHVFFRSSLVFPIGPFWAPYGGPYWAPYGYPSVIVTPSPQVDVQPAPQTSAQPSWYYCANPQGYYPYVHQCPGGWRPVVPTPPPTPP